MDCTKLEVTGLKCENKYGCINKLNNLQSVVVATLLFIVVISGRGFPQFDGIGRLWRPSSK